MAKSPSVEPFLFCLLEDFRWHVREYHGDQPTQRLPSLTNPVHPILKLERWVTYPGQHFVEIYQRILPALQLASLFLCEDGPLLWYSRLTFSERRLNAVGKAYLVPTPYSTTPQALALVKTNLKNLSKVITFMFAPQDFHKKSNWGTAYHRREKMPFFQELRVENLPFVPPSSGIANPSIVLSRRFDIFFRKTLATPHQNLDEYYRALLMLASVIGHEVAHSYNFFVYGAYGPLEPFWDITEKSGELGYPWQWNVLGCVPLPMGSKAGDDDNGTFYPLATVKMEEYHSKADQERIMGAIKASTNAEFTQRDSSGNRRTWPAVDVTKFRGSTWCPDETAVGFVASILSIRPRWIAGWFQQTLWKNIKTNWTQKQYYLPPSLGECFVIMYDRSASATYIQRPLHPENEVDAKITRHRRIREGGLKPVKRQV
jgi:hypothetical protein